MSAMEPRSRGPCTNFCGTEDALGMGLLPQQLCVRGFLGRAFDLAVSQFDVSASQNPNRSWSMLTCSVTCSVMHCWQGTVTVTGVVIVLVTVFVTTELV